MNARGLCFWFILFLLVPPWATHAQHQVVFSAKVIRIEPWMPIKITCGVALVTRLAEYEVTTVYRGHIDSRRLTVRHLACNGDELDDLKAGDAVLVVAAKTKKPESHTWRRSPTGIENGPALVVRFSAVAVAKQVFPTGLAQSHP